MKRNNCRILFFVLCSIPLLGYNEVYAQSPFSKIKSKTKKVRSAISKKKTPEDAKKNDDKEASETSTTTVSNEMSKTASQGQQKTDTPKENAKTGMASSDVDSINLLFASATNLLERNQPINYRQFLYTSDEVEILIKAQQCFGETEGKNESDIQRSRKNYASGWQDKLAIWQNSGYQPNMDVKAIQNHYQYELANMEKANSDRLVALQRELNMMEKAFEKYMILFPAVSSVQQAMDNVSYLKKKLVNSMESIYGKNMTGTFHKENVGVILFSERPINIGNESLAQFTNTITLDEHTDGVNKGFQFVYYDYQTHREKNIAKVKYSITIEGGAPFCGEGNRKVVNTKAHDQAYFQENLLLDLDRYNTDNYNFVADNDKQVLAGCLGALLPGEYTLNLTLVRGSGSMPLTQSVKIMVTEGFGQYTQKIQNKVGEASVNNIKFEKEYQASKKYIPFIKNGLASNGESDIIKIVPISGWKDIEITQKDALGRPYVVEKYSLLIFEYSFKGGDGKFYLKKGAMRKPYKGSDSNKKMDYSTQFTQAGRGPWEMSEKNAY